jgi:hypothetical protein
MNSLEYFPHGKLERQVFSLWFAARKASALIQRDRDCLYECHFDPVAKDVIDEAGKQGLAEYDEVLGTLQRAIALAEDNRPFLGLVHFVYTPNGWKVSGVHEYGYAVRPFQLTQMRIRHGAKTLTIEGTFHRRPRLHTFCKRPHKEIVHA